MELLLLGTAGGEGWPAPFCLCVHCVEARRRGGPNIRSRTGALIDDDLKIDFCADTVVQMQRSGRTLAHLETLVFTHEHPDHLIPQELWWITPPFTRTPPPKPVAVYGNAHVLAIIREQLPQMSDAGQRLDLHLLEALRPVTSASGDTILPLPATHIPDALLLRITRSPTRGGKTIFYGHDSGLYPGATMDALAAGPPLDIALLECTMGVDKTEYRGHLSVAGVIQMTTELRRLGAITPATQVIVTHFSHNGGLLHEEMVQTFTPHGIVVAFDGMTVRV